MNGRAEYRVVQPVARRDDNHRVINAMSIDVEDYYHAHALESQYPRNQWFELEKRVERSTQRLLDLFDEHNVRITFFVLGTVAENFPALIREMINRGHEVASHGLDHYKANGQDPQTFRQDVSRSKTILEQIISKPVSGYRAASFSIGPANWWAYEILAEAGFTYSSSLCNGRLDRADLSIPAIPFYPTDHDLLEIPITTLSMLRRKIPSGGGFFRLMPYAIFKQGFASALRKKAATSMVFYAHPWEIDPDQPVASVNMKTRLRHYGGLSHMENKLTKLLTDFSWAPMREVYEEVIPTLSKPQQASGVIASAAYGNAP
ncbi:XrtA system polysaccharide deacetylase [Sneathiella sp.]|jgi:polysaccharide deacetylase family protein (PEP-CTERM system associated)|uniref:XrtA system polysaccharide deacetylase n=1 Tax=Sneathiella sp. TaxID=1964365 RepID=UPI0039E4BAC7